MLFLRPCKYCILNQLKQALTAKKIVGFLKYPAMEYTEAVSVSNYSTKYINRLVEKRA